MYLAKNIVKSFGGPTVLRGVTLEIEPNKTTVLIGPSGSGKTTLLRCLNLLELPDEGIVDLNGISVKFVQGKKVKMDAETVRSLRKKTGMVFQNFQLFPHMTVLQNIMEGPLVVLKREKEEVKKEALELLRKVGLEDKKDAYPHELSGGQQQRIAIARALSMHPELLLFDEPTSALDPELEYDVLNLIKELVEEKRTIVIVTHKMSFARDVADKIVFLDDGQIIKQGTYEELNKVERIAQFFHKLE